MTSPRDARDGVGRVGQGPARLGTGATAARLGTGDRPPRGPQAEAAGALAAGADAGVLGAAGVLVPPLDDEPPDDDPFDDDPLEDVLLEDAGIEAVLPEDRESVR